jgi:hypothetical protein
MTRHHGISCHQRRVPGKPVPGLRRGQDQHQPTSVSRRCGPADLRERNRAGNRAAAADAAGIGRRTFFPGQHLQQIFDTEPLLTPPHPAHTKPGTNTPARSVEINPSWPRARPGVVPVMMAEPPETPRERVGGAGLPGARLFCRDLAPGRLMGRISPREPCRRPFPRNRSTGAGCSGRVRVRVQLSPLSRR